MFKKYLYGIPFFALAFAILSVSVLQTASVDYAFTAPTPIAVVLGAKVPDIDYDFPFPGSVNSDSPLWPFKALRDKAWYFLTPSPLKKAELSLLFSDKRLILSRLLFIQQKPDVGVSTLAKAEKYLEASLRDAELADKAGYDTAPFFSKLAQASLKHRQIIEEDIFPLAPEDAKPEVIKLEDYSKRVYEEARNFLNSKGNTSPINPFDGQ